MDPVDVRKANVAFHRALVKSYGQQPFFRPENQQRVRSLLSELAAETGGGRLLDVGCGTGFILDLAHDLFKLLDGVDITPEMIGRVTPRPNVRVQLAPAEDLPFEDNEFDVVTMYSVIHHLPDLKTVFKEARRVLRAGGILYADESLSQHYRTAVLEQKGRALGGALSSELGKIESDTAEFCARYGIDPQLTRKAMVQNYEVRGLTEENLRAVLRDVGFLEVDIRFRLFCGEEILRVKTGASEAERVREYLNDMLPLTRHLFKYFVLRAK